MYIAIAGNIGAGKTELGKVLSAALQAKLLPEQEELHDPIIKQFYEDMGRWAFHLQIHFLESRLHKVMYILKQPREKRFVLDRTLYEDAEVFAHYLSEVGILSTSDYQLYVRLYRKIVELIPPPDLLIFLDGSVSTLVKRIMKRNRPYEANLRLSYLSALNKRFREWYEGYGRGKKLRIDIDRYDFMEREEDRYEVVRQVEQELFGLFPE
jgi:deoxyadenosine/deoxycytidine kinase